VTTKYGEKAFAANLGYGDFDLRPFGCRGEVLFEIGETPLFILANQKLGRDLTAKQIPHPDFDKVRRNQDGAPLRFHFTSFYTNP
jgi:hypothetical protein